MVHPQLSELLEHTHCIGDVSPMAERQTEDEDTNLVGVCFVRALWAVAFAFGTRAPCSRGTASAIKEYYLLSKSKGTTWMMGRTCSYFGMYNQMALW